MTDAFEHFDEQQTSYELLDEHRDMLARDAAEVVKQHPGAQPVGLIMDADASEAAQLRAALEQQAGQSVAGFIGVVPRRMVLDILRANAPNTLDFLEPESDGATRRLPLVAVTRNGFRFGVVEYEAE